MIHWEWLRADWSAPDHVIAGTTLRKGGCSEGGWSGLNLAMHVGDDPQHVAANRRALATPGDPRWLEQVHGTEVIQLEQDDVGLQQGDASCTSQTDVVCAVLTADCLPLLVTDQQGSQVAAIHAGWRGLHAGVIENTLSRMQAAPDELLVWLGPAIGPDVYEIGDEVRDAFCRESACAESAFTATRPGHWLMDIYQLARQRLQLQGVSEISGGDRCTFSEEENFYSYRRDGVTGRMASLVWMADNSSIE